MFGFLPVIFRKFVPELWPLIDIRILFPLNILTTNGRNLTSFWVYIDFDKIKVGVGMHDILMLIKRRPPQFTGLLKINTEMNML